jgi:hypothetical protein
MSDTEVQLDACDSIVRLLWFRNVNYAASFADTFCQFNLPQQADWIAIRSATA